MKPRSHVLIFDHRFVPAVQSGKKRQTYRKQRAREIRPGDWLLLRTWSGVAYRSKQTDIADVVCTSVEKVTLTAESITEEMARADGFACREDMILYFDPPFEGVLIEWSD